MIWSFVVRVRIILKKINHRLTKIIAHTKFVGEMIKMKINDGLNEKYHVEHEHWKLFSLEKTRKSETGKRIGWCEMELKK